MYRLAASPHGILTSTGKTDFFENSSKKEKNLLGTILIVILILALLGALPRWPHSKDWGYYPTGGLGMILVIVVILLLIGRI